MSFLSKSLFAIAALCLFAGYSNAITIDYGDLNGTDVMYLNISEDTREEPEALFGAPDIVGNTMDFDPLSFTAEASSSTGTNESDITDGQLNFTIMSNEASFPIEQVIINESGDYTLAGLGSAQATASVSAPVQYAITHVNGVILGAPISGNANLAFSPTGGSYVLPGDAGTGIIWNGNLTLDITAILAAEMVDGHATKIEFALDNTLSVAAADGGSAFIAKKDSGVKVMIPEPSSLSLLGLGLLMALRSLRRK